jgi:hypothetical protein
MFGRFGGMDAEHYGSAVRRVARIAVAETFTRPHRMGAAVGVTA